MFRTHYDNLQVARNASDIVIRAAYKTLTQQRHPDKHPDNKERATRITKIVNEAYRVLSDPDLRKRHDEWILSQQTTEYIERNTHAYASSESESDDDYPSYASGAGAGDQDVNSSAKRASDESVWDRKTCPKCNYERKPTDDNPEWQCPSCKVAYAKVLEDGGSRPSVGTLLVTVDDFRLCDNCFFYKGTRHELSEISSVRGGQSKFSINLVPLEKISNIAISLRDGTEISIDEQRTFFGGVRHKKIQEVLSWARRLTFESRLKMLMAQLRRDGILELYGPISVGGYSNDTEEEVIYLQKEGIIKCGTRSIDIKRARASGTFSLGTQSTAILGSSFETNPGEVAISLNRPVLGNYLPKDVLRFTPYVHDPDVVFALLEWLSKPGNSL